MLGWGLAGLALLVFIIGKNHARVMIDTAECLFIKTPRYHHDWLKHLPQLIFRTIFETCNPYDK